MSQFSSAVFLILEFNSSVRLMPASPIFIITHIPIAPVAGTSVAYLHVRWSQFKRLLFEEYCTPAVTQSVFILCSSGSIDLQLSDWEDIEAIMLYFQNIKRNNNSQNSVSCSN